MENEFGTLASGMSANFVVLDENPYLTLETLSHPVMTVKRGVIVKNDKRVNHVNN